MTTQIATSTRDERIAKIKSAAVLDFFSDHGIEVVYTCPRDMAADGGDGLERYAFLRGDVYLSVLIVVESWRSGIRFDRPVLSVARSENRGRTYVEVGRDLTEIQAAYLVMRHFDLLRNGDE